MLKVKFVKDYDQTGNKAGDIINLRNKIPPHLAEYVERVSDKKETTDRDDAQTEITESQKKALANEKKVFNETRDEAASGDPVAAAKAQRPDEPAMPVGAHYDPTVVREENKIHNPEDVQRVRHTPNNRVEEKPETAKKSGGKKN